MFGNFFIDLAVTVVVLILCFLGVCIIVIKVRRKTGHKSTLWKDLELPESAYGLSDKCVALEPGETLEIAVEGGLKTARTVMAIANSYLGPDKTKVIRAWQNIEPLSDTVVFECVKVR